MKKIDLVHTTILIVAILAAYQAIMYIISILSILAFAGNEYMFKQASSQFAFTAIMTVSFAVLCVILVKNGRKYAGLLLKDEPEGSWEDAPKWDLDRNNILLALFIGIGLYTLVQSIPHLITDFYQLFSEKVGSSMHDGSRTDSLLLECLRTTVGFVLIYAAPNLTQFIERTIAVRLDANDSRS